MEEEECGGVGVDPFTASALGQLDILTRNICYDNLNVNGKNSDNWTMLMYACYYNRQDVVSFLVSNLADKSIQNKAGRNAMMIATMNGNVDILNLVYEDKILNLTDLNGISSLNIAIEYGHEKVAEFLLSKGADPNIYTNNETCLMVAAEKGIFSIVHLLLRHGADIKITNHDGKTAKDIADEKGYTDIVNLIKTYEEADIEPILRLLGLEEYLPNFKNSISFYKFLHMTEEEMKELGITVFGRRRRLSMFLNQIKGSYDGLF